MVTSSLDPALFLGVEAAVPSQGAPGNRRSLGRQQQLWERSAGSRLGKALLDQPGVTGWSGRAREENTLGVSWDSLRGPK